MAIACDVSRHERPAMEPESSIKITVSKVARKAYLSSVPDALVAVEVFVGRSAKDGPVGLTGDGEYAGGGSFDGTVKAFMPGLSGRRVAGEGFDSGFGLGDRDLLPTGFAGAASSAGAGRNGLPELCVSTALADSVDLALFLRPSLLRDPKTELLFDAEPRPHELLGIVGASTTECVIVLEVMKVEALGVDID